MYYCPGCSADLLEADSSACPRCGALFGDGAAWKPLSAPPTSDNQGEYPKIAQAVVAAILLVFGFGFLCLSLALRGTPLAASIPFVFGSALLVAGSFAARAGSRESSKLVLVGGFGCIAAVIGAFALLVSAWPH